MLNERLRKRLAADQASFIERCLPSPASKPPAGSNWIHETKHDGYRLIERRDPVGIRLISRQGNVYCGPVLRHSAGAIQAANFRSAVAF